MRPSALLEFAKPTRESLRLFAGLLGLEPLQARFHRRELGACPAALAVLAVVKLAFALRNEALSRGDGLAARGDLLARPEEDFLGVSELREPRLDLRQTFGVWIRGRQCGDLGGSALELQFPCSDRLLAIDERAFTTRDLELIFTRVPIGIDELRCQSRWRCVGSTAAGLRKRVVELVLALLHGTDALGQFSFQIGEGGALLLERSTLVIDRRLIVSALEGHAPIVRRGSVQPCTTPAGRLVRLRARGALQPVPA